MSSLKSAQVTLPSDRDVRVVREFGAPRELVYAAYTEPDLVRRWLLGPEGWTMPVCEMDVRPGGRFRWRWRSEGDGSEFGFHGEFLEVEAPSLIRNTEYFDQGDRAEHMDPCTVTVRFRERNRTTTLDMLIEYASQEARDGALATGMTDGMELSYQRLEGLLEERGRG